MSSEMGETMSDWFKLTAGVRQGGVLSPAFYSIYTDGLIQILKSKGIGCYIRDNFAAAIFYADDMALIAPSIKGLQALIDCCAEYCSAWDICLNPKKTKNMAFGKKINSVAEVTLNGRGIEWVNQWKYLGVSLVSGKEFGCTVEERI